MSSVQGPTMPLKDFANEVLGMKGVKAKKEMYRKARLYGIDIPKSFKISIDDRLSEIKNKMRTFLGHKAKPIRSRRGTKKETPMAPSQTTNSQPTAPKEPGWVSSSVEINTVIRGRSVKIHDSLNNVNDILDYCDMQEAKHPSVAVDERVAKAEDALGASNMYQEDVASNLAIAESAESSAHVNIARERAVAAVESAEQATEVITEATAVAQNSGDPKTIRKQSNVKTRAEIVLTNARETLERVNQAVVALQNKQAQASANNGQVPPESAAFAAQAPQNRVAPEQMAQQTQAPPPAPAPAQAPAPVFSVLDTAVGILVREGTQNLGKRGVQANTQNLEQMIRASLNPASISGYIDEVTSEERRAVQWRGSVALDMLNGIVDQIAAQTLGPAPAQAPAQTVAPAPQQQPPLQAPPVNNGQVHAPAQNAPANGFQTFGQASGINV